MGTWVTECGICGAPVEPGTRYRIQCVGETGALVGRKPQMVTEWSATMCPRCFLAMTMMREALAERGRAERGAVAVTDRERERRLAASRRGAAAQHAKMPAGPRVDRYERKVDIRAQVAAEDERRGRCTW